MKELVVDLIFLTNEAEPLPDSSEIETADTIVFPPSRTGSYSDTLKKRPEY